MWRLEIHIHDTKSLSVLLCCEDDFIFWSTPRHPIIVTLNFGTSLCKKGLLGDGRRVSYLIPNSSSSHHLSLRQPEVTNVKMKLRAFDSSWSARHLTNDARAQCLPYIAKTRQRWSCQRCVWPWLPWKHSPEGGLSLQRLWKVNAFPQS